VEHGALGWWLAREAKASCLVDLCGGNTGIGLLEGLAAGGTGRAYALAASWAGREGELARLPLPPLLMHEDPVEAAQRFKAASVHVLHLDGASPEPVLAAVLEAFAPKLTPDALILLSRIGAHEASHGVRFWSTLRQRMAFHLELSTGGGLGLAQNGSGPARFPWLVPGSSEQQDLIRLFTRLTQLTTTPAISPTTLQARADRLRQELLEERQRRGAQSQRHSENQERRLKERRKIEKQFGLQAARQHRLEGRLHHLLAYAAQLHGEAIRLSSLQQTTLWRATKPFRRVRSLLPDVLANGARRSAKAAFWLATPHKLPSRLKTLRNRKMVRDLPEVEAEQPPVSKSAGMRTEAEKPFIVAKADASGSGDIRYGWAEKPQDYVYIPPEVPDDLEQRIAELKAKPLFSIVVPLYNTPLDVFRLMVRSVETQWYERWELILVDDNSPQPHLREVLRDLRDPRIKVILLEENRRISGATNAGLDVASGDYVVFLDHDDELTPDCLFELALAVDAHNADYIYSDEDKITKDGLFEQPFFKPDWSPDALMSIMYTCHVSCIRRSLIEQVGRLRSEYDGAQDWDLVLRVTERTNRIVHVPKVLYHWRIIPASAASDPNAKPYAITAGIRAREDALTRRGFGGVLVELPHAPGQFRVAYDMQGEPLISIIIPTRDNGAILDRCVTSILHLTKYRNFEIIIMDNGSMDDETVALLALLAEDPRVRVVPHDAPFNYSKINNIGRGHARGDLLVFLNDDTEVISADWLSAMGGYCQLPHIGAVGAKLLYPETGRIQHVGVMNIVNGPSHAFLNHSADVPLYFSRNMLEYNWVAITGACLMIRSFVFDEVGGFDEDMAIAYNDVELCYRLCDRDLFNVVCPDARLYHYESVSRGLDFLDPEKFKRLRKDKCTLDSKHPRFFMHDPFYSRHLGPNDINFGLPLP
jgi:glycosyltransferase involved in cell wall biosynthesis